MRCLWCCLFAVMLGFDIPAAASTPVATASGVIVERAESLVMGQATALAPGDRLVAYAQPVHGDSAPVRIAIDNALQWRIFQSGALARGPATLEVFRDGVLLRPTLVDGAVRLSIRSAAAVDALEAADTRLLDAVQARDWQAADAAYAEAVRLLSERQQPDVRALIALHGAMAAIAHFEWGQGRERLASALQSLPPSLLRVNLMLVDAQCTSKLRQPEVSEATLKSALPVLEREAPHSLLHARVAAALAQMESFDDPKSALVHVEIAVADARAACGRCDGYGAVLTWYGDVLSAMSRNVDAAAAYAESVDMARVFAPAGYELGARLLRHARPLQRDGQLELAEAKLSESLTLMRANAAPERELSLVYATLGTVASSRGDLDAAGTWYQQAMDINDRLNPGGLQWAAAKHNLATIAIGTGDYATAEQLLHESIAVMEREDNGLYLSIFLNTFAELEMRRGNDDLAEPILERVRDLQIGINPDAEVLGVTYIELAKLYLRGRRIEESDAAWAKAFAIFDKLPADSLLLIEPLVDFAYADLSLGRLDQAASRFQRAFELVQIRAPGTARAAIVLQGAAEAALARNEYARAERLLNEAIVIRRRDASNTASLAQSLHTLGRIARVRQQHSEARALLCEAAEVLDRASLRVGGDDLGETRFRAQFAEVYHDCLAATADAGDTTAALAVLERARARGFRHALEQRRLNLGKVELRRAMSALETQSLAYDRAVTSANDIGLDAQVRDNARHRVRTLQSQRTALQRDLAAVAPEIARAYSLAAPDVEALQARIPEDAAYVAFSLGESSALVIALRHGKPAIARHVPGSRSTYEARVHALRALIASPASSQQEYLEQSAALFHDLLDPVRPYLRGATRLLISADGALHDLPFAALWQPDDGRYLIESYALAFVDSLSAAHLNTVRPSVSDANATLLAVGDPGHGQSPSPEVTRRWRSVRGDVSALPSLPAARREVQALAERYPTRTQLLVGAAATEKRVRVAAPHAGQIHFAVHALFDVLHPLESALVLTPGASGPVDDGLLQVWEIFEGLQLHASLVVLSGCDTAAGQQFAGEGLLGFSRAFAFAGARATVASLWPVEDDSTAELMERFYEARDRDLTDAQALQAAMLGMIHNDQNPGSAGRHRGVGGLAPRVHEAGGARRPQDWAAFQLFAQ